MESWNIQINRINAQMSSQTQAGGTGLQGSAPDGVLELKGEVDTWPHP